MTEIASAVASLTGTPRLTLGSAAADLLNVTEDHLGGLLLAGVMDAVVVGGKVYVDSEDLHRYLGDQSHLGAIAGQEARLRARAALRGYLGDTEVTGSYEEAIAARAPLVCRRRGGPFVQLGIDHHGVCFRLADLAAWVREHGMRRRPELVALPVGAALAELLTELPGVSTVTSVSPLYGEPRKRSVRRWLRVDPAQWALEVPLAIEYLVNGEEDR